MGNDISLKKRGESWIEVHKLFGNTTDRKKYLMFGYLIFSFLHFDFQTLTMPGSMFYFKYLHVLLHLVNIYYQNIFKDNY